MVSYRFHAQERHRCALQQSRMSVTPSLAGDSSFFLDLYARYARDPLSVPADWRVHFENLDGPVRPAESFEAARRLRDAYRLHGHLQASLDPLGLLPEIVCPEIEAARHDLDPGGPIPISIGGETVQLSAADAAAKLSAIYCGSAALEAGHVTDAADRTWLHECFEREITKPINEGMLSRTLEAVMLADEFETFGEDQVADQETLRNRRRGNRRP